MTFSPPELTADLSPVDDVIGLIYDAATEMEKWQTVLAALARHFGAFAGDFTLYDVDDNRFSMHLMHGLDRVPASLALRYQELKNEDPRLLSIQRQFGQHPVAATVQCRMLVTEKELRSSRIYQEVLAPAGIEYAMSTHVVSGAHMIWIGLMRGPLDPAFTEQDCADLHRLNPHLQRATSIQRRLIELDFAGRSSLDVLDKLPTAIVIVDGGFRVHVANEAARRLLDRKAGLVLREDRLIVEDRSLAGELSVAVAEALGAAHHGTTLPGRSFAISGRSLRLGVLWGNYLKFGLAPLAEPLAILFIGDSGARLRPSDGALRSLFGLTQAEAEVAAALAIGEKLNVIAEDLGRSPETCRSQLKSIFAKTNTSRQADLIRLILASPSWIDP